ncbi:methyltransferase domain-containing protein [Pseudomonas chengduensis]|nr:methyltransferase domain-containing protein [Pseudomonas chengduensis]MDH1683280.1 methyltransferase domain-containing protein [Pseudomonas chengduensis]
MPIEQIECTLDFKNIATHILTTCGHCRALILGGPPKALLRELWLAGLDASAYELAAPVRESEFRLPFSDESFDAVISFKGIELFSDASLPAMLEEVRRVTRRSLMLFIDTSWPGGDSLKVRRDWEASCFDAGFRKHPLYYRGNDYASLEHDSEQLFIPLEKLPPEALAKYPMASLREERDLHMDMLRESGSRSDAHVGRYHFAARFIRPGDAVLDAACGLGYGTYVIRSETQARSCIGIDASEYGIDYARLNFGGEATSFVQGMLPDCLMSIPDNSIDHVLCFETLEHVLDPVRVLAEFQRVLTPGGRLTCSVPHDWSDETGADPNPFHFHVYDKTRFVGELSQYFDLEHLVAQTADRVKQPGSACVWLKRPRSLTDIDIEQSTIEAEWLLAVATKSPLDGCQVPYTEQVFSNDEQRQAGNALAFARDYSNPWLIRALVSIGLRTDNTSLRERWAESVWVDHTAGPADRGAALCVLVYAALAGERDEPDDRLLDRIDDYLADVADETNLTVLRWRASLMYAGGLLALSSGRREIACRFLNGVIAAPVAQYSTTLLTKPAEAAYLLGLILVSEGRGAEAHRTWWEAFQLISASLGKRLAQGYDSRPPAFEIREMAAALSLCGRLVAAAAHGAEQHCRPSVFYDECHADSLFQIQSFWGVEAALANLRQDYLEQQSGLDEISRGKDWLESQWKVERDERGRLLEALASLQAGKDWLESQWKVERDDRGRLLEALASLQAGKDWLESQWEAQAIELDNRQQCIATQETQIARLSSDLELAREEATRLKQNMFFRVAKKLGFFSYF